MRVLILEDDPWIADLLKQIVQNLHPSTQIESVTRLADALDAWKRQPAQLVIADWNLPDGPGTSLLEVAHRSDASVPLVMITARSDRDSVLLARRLGIDAFISKPFQVPKVLETLRPLLSPQHDEPADAAVPATGGFLPFLAGLPNSALDLPLHDALFQQLHKPDQAAQALQEHWQNDPAVHARLIAAANSASYNASGQPCISLPEALRRLGPGTVLSLVQGLALRPVAALQDDDLKRLGDEQFTQARYLRQRIEELCKSARIDAAAMSSAALLQRMGELAVLYQAQCWRHAGQALDDATLGSALQRCSGDLANRLKSHWRLPTPLRELIGACYALPPGNSKRDPVIMRLACAELQGGSEQELERLYRLAGIDRGAAR